MGIIASMDKKVSTMIRENRISGYIHSYHVMPLTLLNGSNGNESCVLSSRSDNGKDLREEDEDFLNFIAAALATTSRKLYTVIPHNTMIQTIENQ